jgi:REP element-mobilizing transposase RayT
MSHHSRILCHLIIHTKDCKNSLPQEQRTLLYSAFEQLAEEKHCHVLCIDGTDNHVHLLCELHPDVSPGELIRKLKGASTVWLRGSKKFPAFDDWANGYTIVSCGLQDEKAVRKLIAGQEKYHRRRDFSEELRDLLKDYAIPVDERFFP